MIEEAALLDRLAGDLAQKGAVIDDQDRRHIVAIGRDPSDLEREVGPSGADPQRAARSPRTAPGRTPNDAIVGRTLDKTEATTPDGCSTECPSPPRGPWYEPSRNDKTPHFCGVLKRGGRDSKRSPVEERQGITRTDVDKASRVGPETQGDAPHEVQRVTPVTVPDVSTLRAAVEELRRTGRHDLADALEATLPTKKRRASTR
ncbi:MAG: hypothetical protein K1X94_03235 [Sandaracinaceae bacterium]|nr:hypothetical protein [Sandaracinaceae bacterium]